MKPFLLLSILMIAAKINYSQELKDTTNIIVEFNKNTNSYLYKVQGIQTLKSGNNFKYPSDPADKYSPAPDAHSMINNAILQSFSTKTIDKLKGKQIVLYLKMNGCGTVTNVVFSISQNYVNKNDISSKEASTLIQNIKKLVKFCVAEDAKNWPDGSFVIAHKIF